MSNRHLVAALAAACALAASGASYGAGVTGSASNGLPGTHAGSPAPTGAPHAYAGYHGSNGTPPAIHGGDRPFAYNGSYHDDKGRPHAYNGGSHDQNGKPHASNGSYHDDNGRPYAYNGGGMGYQASNGGGSDTPSGSTGGDDGLLAHGSGVSHQALLAGGNEVSSTGKADAGDADGNGAGSISIDPEAGKVCFALVVNNIDAPVAAHIHQGAAGRNGPVVVTLRAPASGDPGSSSGCVDNVDRAVLQLIHAHPGAYYINVHSGLYPDGAVRGQLH